jgi:hypothetical protein
MIAGYILNRSRASKMKVRLFTDLKQARIYAHKPAIHGLLRHSVIFALFP